MVYSTLLRPALLAAGRSTRLQRTLTGMPVTRQVVNRFVAGEGVAEVETEARALVDSGRLVSIDFLGEGVTDVDGARDTVAEYRRLLSTLGTARSCSDIAGSDETPTAGSASGGSEPHDAGVAEPGGPVRYEVSMKLSALGAALPRDAWEISLDHARQVCAAARDAGVWVSVDAEDSSTTEVTLSIVRALREDFPDTGAVIQAYLFRSADDCRDLAGPGSRIRLCKGAYREPASVAHQSRDDVSDAYLRCLRILMDGDGYPMVATHDPDLIAAAVAEGVRTGRGVGDYELQMLYGIRDDEQRRQTERGRRVRVYLPYGTAWYPYFMRRLAERPANLGFFLRALASRS